MANLQVISGCLSFVFSPQFMLWYFLLLVLLVSHCLLTVSCFSIGSLKAARAASTVLCNMFQYSKLHKDYKLGRLTDADLTPVLFILRLHFCLQYSVVQKNLTTYKQYRLEVWNSGDTFGACELKYGF